MPSKGSRESLGKESNNNEQQFVQPMLKQTCGYIQFLMSLQTPRAMTKMRRSSLKEEIKLRNLAATLTL